MKKIVLIAIAMFAFTFAKAQTDVGAGVFAFSSNIGAEVKADFFVTDVISISPSIDYMFMESNPLYDQSWMFFNVDGHYNFELGDTFTAYPIVGLNYFYYSFDYTGSSEYSEYGDFSVDYSGGDIGLTVGGGAKYAITDSIKLFAELKYMQTDLGISAGLMFGL